MLATRGPLWEKQALIDVIDVKSVTGLEICH